MDPEQRQQLDRAMRDRLAVELYCYDGCMFQGRLIAVGLSHVILSHGGRDQRVSAHVVKRIAVIERLPLDKKSSNVVK